MDHADIEFLKLTLGLLGGAIVFLCGLVSWLLHLSFKLGTFASEIHEVGKNMIQIKERTDRVPVIEQRIGTLETAWTRTQDDLRVLRHKTGNPSVPDFNGEAEE